jgi:hypothetical protein
LGLFNLKIGPWAFKIWAIITGLKIYKTLLNMTSKKFVRPFGPEGLNFPARWALPIFPARQAQALGLI